MYEKSKYFMKKTLNGLQKNMKFDMENQIIANKNNKIRIQKHIFQRCSWTPWFDSTVMSIPRYWLNHTFAFVACLHEDSQIQKQFHTTTCRLPYDCYVLSNLSRV